MARIMRPQKPLIYVFCEGESEQAYSRFLKEHFSDVASIQTPVKGLFNDARDKFNKAPKFRDYAEVTDEIWFFFDVEETDHDKWDKRYEIIKKLRKLRKKPNIRIRLLMTTACVEYWFMLHYELLAPALSTVADKERMLHRLEQKVQDYAKGDQETTNCIAVRYPTAVQNGKRVLHNLLGEGLPTLEDTDERNRWLHQSSKTFTTVQEAIAYLESLTSASE